MSKRALVEFLEAQIADAKAQDVLLSVHLKATMMKVSDPIIFGHAVEAYFSALFAEHAATFDEIGVSANDGLPSLTTATQELPADQRAHSQEGHKRRPARGPARQQGDRAEERQAG